MLLLLQLLLPLMFDTVEALHNCCKHGCDTRGNLAMHNLLRPHHLLRRLGRGLKGQLDPGADGFGVAHTSGLSKFDQVPSDVTLLCLTSTTANVTS